MTIVHLSRKDSCYDCGSTIEGHHTETCDMCVEEEGDVRDLPSIGYTQWWTKEIPNHLK